MVEDEDNDISIQECRKLPVFAREELVDEARLLWGNDAAEELAEQLGTLSHENAPNPQTKH